MQQDEVAGLDSFQRAFGNQRRVVVAPVYRVASPHYDGVAELFANFEHSVAQASRRRCEERGNRGIRLFVGKVGKYGAQQFFRDDNLLAVACGVEFRVVAVEIAVVAELKAFGGKTHHRIAVFLRPFSAYEKGSVPSAFGNEAGDFFHIFRALVDVEHQSHASAFGVALVDRVVRLDCGGRFGGERKQR